VLDFSLVSARGSRHAVMGRVAVVPFVCEVRELRVVQVDRVEILIFLLLAEQFERPVICTLLENWKDSSSATTASC